MSSNSSLYQRCIFSTHSPVLMTSNASEGSSTSLSIEPLLKKTAIRTSLTQSAISSIWVNVNANNLAKWILVFLAFRVAITVIHRLYFHPLAPIPGPRIAAATRLYEFYYQGLQHTKFPQHIKELHQKYGPIVRISPFEVSLNDSEFNADFFLQDRKLDKDPWYYFFGFNNALFVLTDRAKHKHRQGNLANHFRGDYWKAARPMITDEIGAMMAKFADSAAAGSELNLSKAYRKTGNEVMRNFLLGSGEGGPGSDSRDFARGADTFFHPLFRGASWIRHFNWMMWIQRLTPDWVFELTMPMAKYQREIQGMIRRLIETHDAAGKPATNSALLYKIIDHDPSYRDDGAASAVEEFMELLWGGREVLGHSLSNVSFHLMTNPACMARLHDELRAGAAAHHLDLATAPYADLQRLPYLWAVCKEGIRLQRGGNFRIPRVCAHDVAYKEYVLPAGTAISMSPNFFHQDPRIFPEPEKFIPERWLVGDVDTLEKYWNPFGNGSRSCGGRPMAYEVIFRGVANIFSKYRMDFSNCTPDYCMQEGMMEVFPPGNSTGLRVKISKWED